MRKQELISVQSTSFLRIVFDCLAQALPIYSQHLGRPPVAGPENIACSAAIILLVVSLESHVTRLMYFQAKGLTTDDPLLKKLSTFLPEPEYKVLLSHLGEVTVCRDAITHAHLWEEVRTFDNEWHLTDTSWSLARVTAPRAKVWEYVDLTNGAVVTRALSMNVIPTNVDFVDVAKALVALCQTMRVLEARYGNPAAWVGPFPSAEELVPIFLKQRDDTLEAWVSGVLRYLHPAHKADVVRRLGLQEVQADGDLYFVGLDRAPDA